MTTLTSPHDLLAAVPFLVGYSPKESLIVIALKDDAVGMAMRVDYPEDIDIDQIDSLASHLVREKADGALVVAYIPEGVFDSEYLLAPLREAIDLRGIKLRECLEVRHNRWRSVLCADHQCCPPEENPMPDLESSRIAAEQVASGKPLPFKNEVSMTKSISPEKADLELLKLIKQVPKIDFQKEGHLVLQREGALAVNEIAGIFARDGICLDKNLITLVIARLQDLQVRDYAMGITDIENIETLWSMWRWLLKIAPKGFIAPIASLFSAVSYEKGDGAMAQRALDPFFQLRSRPRSVRELLLVNKPVTRVWQDEAHE